MNGAGAGRRRPSGALAAQPRIHRGRHGRRIEPAPEEVVHPCGQGGGVCVYGSNAVVANNLIFDN